MPWADFAVARARTGIARTVVFEMRAFVAGVLGMDDDLTGTQIGALAAGGGARLPGTPVFNFAVDGARVGVAILGVRKCRAVAEGISRAHDHACPGVSATAALLGAAAVGRPNSNGAINRVFIGNPVNGPLSGLGDFRRRGLVEVGTEASVGSAVDGSAAGHEEVVSLAADGGDILGGVEVGSGSVNICVEGGVVLGRRAGAVLRSAESVPCAGGVAGVLAGG